jgi:hypothetical protein
MDGERKIATVTSIGMNTTHGRVNQFPLILKQKCVAGLRAVIVVSEDFLSFSYFVILHASLY